MLYCPDCALEVPAGATHDGRALCPRCQQELTSGRAGAKQSVPPETVRAGAPLWSRLSQRITRTAGVQPLQGFSLRDTFSEVFARHPEADVERYFAVGGPDTTPPLSDIQADWPRPWVFFRMFLLSVVTYFLFLKAWDQFQNIKVLPGLITVGSFAVPFATLMLFFEFNIRRNVSLFQIGKFVMLGGALSIIFALLLYQLTDQLHTQWLGASIAGIVEEPCKLLVLALVINHRRYRFILNGLLLGAAVGTGFAAFESAGYALLIALQDGSGAMRQVIFERGLLSPFGHIVWTAMSAGALWRVMGDRPFALHMLNDMRFKRVFAVAVVLHMLWDSHLALPFDLQYLLYGLVAWVIVLALTQEGIEELRAAQTRAAQTLAPAVLSAEPLMSETRAPV
jgi:RsiW-degrading membrane proteinase PrsW (M82 family)